MKDAYEGRQGCGGSHDTRLYRQNPTTENSHPYVFDFNGEETKKRPRPLWRSFQNQDGTATIRITTVFETLRCWVGTFAQLQGTLTHNNSSMPGSWQISQRTLRIVTYSMYNNDNDNNEILMNEMNECETKIHLGINFKFLV